jgi:hypothetical protein
VCHSVIIILYGPKVCYREVERKAFDLQISLMGNVPKETCKLIRQQIEACIFCSMRCTQYALWEFRLWMVIYEFAREFHYVYRLQNYNIKN